MVLGLRHHSAAEITEVEMVLWRGRVVSGEHLPWYTNLQPLWIEHAAVSQGLVREAGSSFQAGTTHTGAQSGWQLARYYPGMVGLPHH